MTQVRTISQVMTRDPLTLGVEATLLDAMTMLRDHRVRHLPVVDGEGRVLGVVTDRDVKRATPSALLRDQRQVWEEVVRTTPIDRVMTRDPVTRDPATSLAAAVAAFVDERIGCLPVVEGGRLVGIVTAHDLLRAFREHLAGQ